VLDFLKSLDQIVDTALAEKVDLVLFAGDAYKDRTPAPTFQREWGRRMKRLSNAGIFTFMLVGNHDLSPSTGRAHALQEFETLAIPHILVASKPSFFGPAELDGLPLQLMALPWINRSGIVAALNLSTSDPSQVYKQMEERITDILQEWLASLDPSMPAVLAAHCSIQGAEYGQERMVMLGNDLVLPPALVKDGRLDYVALGHIHKYQDLNKGHHPPVIYPGSIERVDFGEAAQEKFFVIAHVEHGHTRIERRKLDGIRPFIDRSIEITDSENVTAQMLAALPAQEDLAGAIVRLVAEYPRALEAQIDEAALREHTAPAFEFQLVRRPQLEARQRLPAGRAVSSYSHQELFEIFLKSSQTSDDGYDELVDLASRIINHTPESPA
jgi:exonuclease SbcD